MAYQTPDFLTHGRPRPDLTATRARRIMAEADEVALRMDAQRRARQDRNNGVPVYDCDFWGDDPVPARQRCGAWDRPALNAVWQRDQLVADMTAEEDQDRDRTPFAWALVFLWIGVVVLVGLGFTLGLWLGALDGQALLDFAAPTAAQARDAGWVALSEGAR